MEKVNLEAKETFHFESNDKMNQRHSSNAQQVNIERKQNNYIDIKNEQNKELRTVNTNSHKISSFPTNHSISATKFYPSNTLILTDRLDPKKDSKFNLNIDNEVYLQLLSANETLKKVELISRRKEEI